MALLLSFSCYAQDEGQDSTGCNFKVYPLPAIGHSPETGTYFGAVALATFRSTPDTNTRESNAKAEFNYSLKNQVIFEVGWNYFSPGERWFSESSFRFSRFPDLFYGYGRDSRDADEVQYNSNRVQIAVNALYQVREKLFIGPMLRFQSYSNINYLDGDSASFIQLSPFTVWGGGLELRKDLRNNLLTPTEGYLSSWRFSLNTTSRSTYLKFQPDQRVYIGDKKLLWANRLYADWNFGDAPPFFDRALLGGDQVVRGIYLGRFRDRMLTTLQTELRWMAFWRIGFTAFGGISDAHPSLDKISIAELKYNAGAGFRFLVDRESNISLRFDYAVASNGQNGFYVAFGEAF